MAVNGNGNGNGNGKNNGINFGNGNALDQQGLAGWESRSSGDLRVPQTPTVKQEQVEYERRLLAVYINYVSQTGQIDYPPLKEVVSKVFEVEVADPGTKLLPDRAVAWVEEVRSNSVDISRAATDLLRALQDLASAIQTKNSHKDAELAKAIRQATGILIGATEELIKIAQRYGSPSPYDRPENSIKQNKKTSKKNQGSNSIDSTKPSRVRRLMGDLEYLRQYVAEQAQFEIIKTEFLPEDSEHSYFRRLYNYLAIYPGLAETLANMLCTALENKVAGGIKFAKPKGG